MTLPKDGRSSVEGVVVGEGQADQVLNQHEQHRGEPRDQDGCCCYCSPCNHCCNWTWAGLLKKFWLMVIGCVICTARSSLFL